MVPGSPAAPPTSLIASCLAGKYEELGSTAVVAAEPAVVDFGGFQPGQLLQQVVCLTNISDAATRVQVIPPDTNEFKVGSISAEVSLYAPHCLRILAA